MLYICDNLCYETMDAIKMTMLDKMCDIKAHYSISEGDLTADEEAVIATAWQSIMGYDVEIVVSYLHSLGEVMFGKTVCYMLLMLHITIEC